MLLWILGEVVVGLLVAGLVAGLVVPASMRFGFDPGPWVGVGITATCIVVCVVVGERMRGRRNARESS